MKNMVTQFVNIVQSDSTAILANTSALPTCCTSGFTIPTFMNIDDEKNSSRTFINKNLPSFTLGNFPAIYVSPVYSSQNIYSFVILQIC